MKLPESVLLGIDDVFLVKPYSSRQIRFPSSPRKKKVSEKKKVSGTNGT